MGAPSGATLSNVQSFVETVINTWEVLLGMLLMKVKDLETRCGKDTCGTGKGSGKTG